MEIQFQRLGPSVQISTHLVLNGIGYSHSVEVPIAEYLAKQKDPELEEIDIPDVLNTAEEYFALGSLEIYSQIPELRKAFDAAIRSSERISFQIPIEDAAWKFGFGHTAGHFYADLRGKNFGEEFWGLPYRFDLPQVRALLKEGESFGFEATDSDTKTALEYVSLPDTPEWNSLQLTLFENRPKQGTFGSVATLQVIGKRRIQTFVEEILLGKPLW